MNTKNIALSLVAAALLAAVPAAAFADSCAKPVHSACTALKASCERPGHPAPQLSAEQAAELQKLRAEHHAALASLRDSIAQKKMELHALAPNPNVKPEELKALAAEISDLRKQMRTLGEEYRAKLEKAGLPCPHFRQDCERPHGPRHGFHGGHGFHRDCER